MSDSTTISDSQNINGTPPKKGDSGVTFFTHEDSQTNSLSLRSLLPWILLIIFAITFQYVMAWLSTPDGMIFTGALLNPDDTGVYVSAMRQGADGRWLYHFVYSPEPWQPRLMLLLYLVLGKITGLFTEPNVLWLHIWRVLLSIVTLGAIVIWIRSLLPSAPRWQWTTWFMIWFAGGIGWLIILVFPSSTRLTPDTGMAEWLPLVALFVTPHFALGLGLEVMVFVCLIKALQSTSSRRWLWAIAGAITAVLATMVYVYHLATILLVVGIYMLALAICERRIPWTKWVLGALVIAPLLPFLLYYAFWTNGDTYWIRYTTIDHVISPPPPLGILVGLGGLTILAIAGSWYWIKSGHTLLVPIWAVASIFLLYLPIVSFSGRFALGLMIPVATLAAAGLEGVVVPAFTRSRWRSRLARISPTPNDTTRRLFLILLMPSILMTILLLAKGPRIQPTFPYYLPVADVAAAEWLGERTDESALTLAYYPMGNYLPYVYDGKVFMGQLDFTTDLPHKLDQFEDFWDGSMTEAARESFLDEWEITHVLVGSYEKEFIGTGVESPGTILFDQDGVQIYAVTDPKS